MPIFSSSVICASRRAVRSSGDNDAFSHGRSCIEVGEPVLVSISVSSGDLSSRSPSDRSTRQSGINLSEQGRKRRERSGETVGAGAVWSWVVTLVVAHGALVSPVRDWHMAHPQRGRPQGSPLHPPHPPPLRILSPLVLFLPRQ